MSFLSKLEVETNMEETDCPMLEPPLSPVFPSESNGKKKPEETNKMSPAGENSKNFLKYEFLLKIDFKHDLTLFYCQFTIRCFLFAKLNIFYEYVNCADCTYLLFCINPRSWKIFSLFSVITRNVDQFIGFSTARGEKLSISEDAIEKANFVLSDENLSAYAEKDTDKNTKNVISKSLNGTNIKGVKSIKGNTLIIPKQVSSKSTDIFYGDKVHTINKCESGEFFFILERNSLIFFHEVNRNIDISYIFHPAGSLE